VSHFTITHPTRHSVLGMISDAHSQMVHENRHYLKTLCEILCLTAERHISQRESLQFRQKDVDLEHTNFGPNSGVFLSLLSLVAKHDEIVAWKVKSGPQNAKYTHHTVQNALLSIMAEIVLQETASEVGSAQYFSILMQGLIKEGAGVSSCSIYIRWFDL